MSDRNEGLFRHSLLLMAAAQVSSVCNILFHSAMGRMLPGPEYGILSSMLAIMLIIGTPLDALRTAFAHYSARAVQEGDPGRIVPLMKQWSLRLLWVAAPAVLVGIVACQPIARYFHLVDATPVFLTALITGGLVFVPLCSGALQGAQSFFWMSATLQGLSLVRLTVSVLFALLVSRTAIAGVAAQGVGVLVVLLIGVKGVRVMVRGAARSEMNVAGIGGYLTQSVVMLSAFALIMNVDVMLVRHYLPDDATRFARAATLGRAIIFLPMPIAFALFPKVVSTGEMTGSNRTLLLKALGMAFAIIGSGLVFFSIFPELPLVLMYKDHDPVTARYFRMMMWALMPMAVTYMLMNFELAQHRFRLTPALIVCAGLYLAGVALWHDSPEHIIAVLASVSMLTALAFVAGIPWKIREER